ncbi:restriction endonuclease subunit S [uncultured Sulfitobacter sp.]|uniref:restriction endonuclease subunit S n=1 Tax=uncultured Sulfitobacter sp. TaxID=191468 RepID=UPI0030DCF40E
MTREVLLADVAREVTVGHVGSMADEYLEDGIPFLRSLNILPHRISRQEIRHISPEFHRRLKKSALKPGDVVIVRTGKPGTCAVIPDDLPVANCSDLVIVRCGPDIRPRFLAYWVNAIATDHVASHLVGAVQQHFNVGAAKKIPIVLPGIAEQDKVLSILGALDDKIELNGRISATLEEMARALYRSWFVDFDPVHARALGQLPAHMDPTTAALFPDSFGPDGLPKGWEWRSLDEIADFLNGAALQKFPPQDGAESLPVIKIAELRSGITAKSGRAGLQVPEKYKINDGDVLFSWSGSLLQKVWTEGAGALNQHLFKVSSEVVPKWFHFFAVDQHMEEFRQVAAAKATTMGHIQRHHLKEAMIAIPEDDGVITAAGELIGPAFDRAIAADLESQALAALRDSLLPRLMSGELRIREAEKQVEEVV